MSGTQRDYEVGRGKPALHSRFKKGQSGNPRGARWKSDVYRSAKAGTALGDHRRAGNGKISNGRRRPPRSTSRSAATVCAVSKAWPIDGASR